MLEPQSAAHVQHVQAGLSKPSKTGILLLNVGTPDAATAAALRRYLRGFLMDGRVLDLPVVWRWLLVNCVIVPFRASRSAAAYREVWTPEGSPLRVLSEKLQAALAEQMGETHAVALGMCNGHPTIEHGLQELREAGCQEVIAVPLFPQYASATNAAATEALFKSLPAQGVLPTLRFTPEFYDEPAYVEGLARRIREAAAAQAPEHYLFSYHGLPERQLQRDAVLPGCPCAQAQADAPCSLAQAPRQCYRAQCYATTQAVVDALGLQPEQYSTSFQSRLGRAKWITPDTESHVAELYARGVRHLGVLTPSFVVDCLESLEEINIRLRELWGELGGEQFTYVPALNHDARWVQDLAKWLRAA